MTFESFAVKILLGISGVLGVAGVAHDHGSWEFKHEWEDVVMPNGRQVRRFEASSTKIIEQCAAHPENHVIFPAVVHGAHEIFLDEHPLLIFGNPDFSTTRSFFGEPTLACSAFAGGHSVKWIAYSSTQYFARISFFPLVSAGTPLYNVFAESFHIIGAGVGLALAILTFIIFAGKVSRETTVAVGLASFFSSFYLGGCVAGLLGFPWDMLTTHKIADLGVWAAICLLLKALYHEGLISKPWIQSYLFVVGLAITIILFGTSGDIVQFGTTIPFGLTLAILLVPMVRLARELAHDPRGQLRWMQFFSLGSFVLAVFNEIFVVTGIAHTSPMLPFGFMGAVMFLSLAVNVRITDTYLERDYLRENLEDEVRLKTQDLELAMRDLRSTQAELVQTAKLASLGTLSAGIAHEINNSLNYVNGGLQPLERLIAKLAPPPEQGAKIDKMIVVMKDGLNLTFDIIKSLRTYTGLNQASQKEVDVAEIIQSSLNILRSRLREKVKVECEIEPGLSMFAMVVGLNQIFMNLFTNAMDAMGDGGTLSIHARSLGEKIEIVVKDTGSGIPQSVIERIYEPFFTTKDVGKGTGLGLHIVRQEVQRHGGEIRVTSEPGLGTTFTMILPKQPLLTPVAAA